MPTNLGNAPLDGLKIGQTEVLRAYVGIDQIFPNATAISAAAFDNATVTNTAQNTDYTVAGEVGSSFTLTGSAGATGPAGTQVLGSTSVTYPIAIGGNDACGNFARSPQIIIAPQGNSVLVGGLNNTDTIAQAAGPAWVNFGAGGAISASFTNSNLGTTYQQINGVYYYMVGAAFSIAWSYNDTSGVPYMASSSSDSAVSGASFTYSAGTTGSGAAASGTYTATISSLTSSTSFPYAKFRLNLNTTNCGLNTQSSGALETGNIPPI